MRLSPLTLCTLAAWSAFNAAQNATAAPPELTQTSPQDVVIAVDQTTVNPVRLIASPESTASPEFSRQGTSFEQPNDSELKSLVRKDLVQKDNAPVSQRPQSATLTAQQAIADPPRRLAQTDPALQPGVESGNSAPMSAPNLLSPEQPRLEPPTPLEQPTWLIPANTPPSSAQAVPPPAPSIPGSPRPTPLPPNLVVTATDVQILGVDAELQQFVRSNIRTQPGGQVSTPQLQADVASILGTGLFSNASVSTQTTPNGLNVTFQVQPVVVQSVRLVNARALTPAIANSYFKTQIGAIVSPTAINQSIRQINQWYAANQYNLARVVAVTPSREGILTLEVAEGIVSDIQIRFTDENGSPVSDTGEPIRGRTRESFLRQQIQLMPGQVFKEDLARQDLQRLFQTGLFNNGQIALEGDARQTRVVYVLTETRSRAVNVSGGYNDDLGLFGNLGYSDRNFNGIGQQIGGNLLIGTRDVQFDGRFVSPYRETEPDKLGYTISGFRRRGSSRVFDDDIRLDNGDRVREGRFGVGVAVNRPIGEGWNGSLGLNYERISLRDSDGDVVRTDARGNPLSFSGTGIDDLTTINFTATRDTRNNFIDPSDGSLLTLTTDQSIPIGRGSILSNRLQANYSQYMPVNLFNLEQSQGQPEVFAFNLQAGTTLGDLPPYNAFSLGGPNSVRGYDAGTVAISRSFILASAEYRFPIYRIIGGAVFADFASDLGSSRSVLGQPGIERDRSGTGFGIGLGVRLKSPFGIIRAGYGINDRGEGRLQIGIGEKF
ncbi:BamA/TamA family outer membrane protein [Myxacorys almedinensis]|uniref:BamA/TamA family outer membrane protein n=1 Tax=Myxacorys almedinensis A TaxID=2690445 RepID=A0A8J8CKR1_9CYAN|nr:BamA/TamA family outer membrane protein [Myxacorys almedinensis]NDJ18876.1 BamA/TamA family outer membrane protein [Myxacorys almedinensis A]